VLWCGTQQYHRGWLKRDTQDAISSSRNGLDTRTANTSMYLGSGPSRRGNTPTPARSTKSGAYVQYKCSLSCFLSYYREIEEEDEPERTQLNLPRTLALLSLIYWLGEVGYNVGSRVTVWALGLQSGPVVGSSRWTRTQSG